MLESLHDSSALDLVVGAIEVGLVGERVLHAGGRPDSYICPVAPDELDLADQGESVVVDGLELGLVALG